MSKKISITSSAEETHKLGKSVGQKLKGGEILALFGDLGSGKTTFVKGLAQGLGIKRRVISPTFTIERIYKADKRLTLYHLDLYRLDEVDEATKMEINEIISDSKNVIVIEWADKIVNFLPKSRWTLYFSYITDIRRSIVIKNERYR
jgi:tRNA threonylcarbamoyladenosine biosynthesis protein TsaE